VKIHATHIDDGCLLTFTSPSVAVRSLSDHVTARLSVRETISNAQRIGSVGAKRGNSGSIWAHLKCEGKSLYFRCSLHFKTVFYFFAIS